MALPGDVGDGEGDHQVQGDQHPDLRDLPAHAPVDDERRGEQAEHAAARADGAGQPGVPHRVGQDVHRRVPAEHRDEVDGGEARGAERPLEELSHRPQRVHVQRQVHDPAVQEARGEEGPRHRERPEGGEDAQLLDDLRSDHLPEIREHAQRDQRVGDDRGAGAHAPAHRGAGPGRGLRPCQLPLAVHAQHAHIGGALAVGAGRTVAALAAHVADAIRVARAHRLLLRPAAHGALGRRGVGGAVAVAGSVHGSHSTTGGWREPGHSGGAQRGAAEDAVAARGDRVVARLVQEAEPVAIAEHELVEAGQQQLLHRLLLERRALLAQAGPPEQPLPETLGDEAMAGEVARGHATRVGRGRREEEGRGGRPCRRSRRGPVRRGYPHCILAGQARLTLLDWT